MKEGEQAFKPLNFFLTTIGVLIMDRSWLHTKARSLRTVLFIVFPRVCIPEGNKMDFLLKIDNNFIFGGCINPKRCIFCFHEGNY